MPLLLKGINLLLIKDKVVRDALQEIVALMENASEANFGDFETRGGERGIVVADGQSPPRKWRIRVMTSGETKGGGELQISSTGTATAAREASAKGTIIIKIDDVGN